MADPCETPVASSEKEIASLLANYTAAAKEGNVDKIVNLYTLDGVLIAEGASTVRGKLELLDRYTEIFDKESLDISFIVHEVVTDNSVAFVWTNTTGKITNKQTGAVRPESKREFFFLLSTDYGWKIARYMYTNEVFDK